LHEEAPLEGDLEDTMVHAVEDLVACIGEGRAPLCGGNDGLAALRIAAAVIESARQGREMALETA
jgi:predicted dehydrogenase